MSFLVAGQPGSRSNIFIPKSLPKNKHPDDKQFQTSQGILKNDGTDAQHPADIPWMVLEYKNGSKDTLLLQNLQTLPLRK